MGKITTSLLISAIGIGLHFLLNIDTFDNKSISGKRVLITGASSGIGEQLAYEYSKLGARVLITARRRQLLEQVAKKCGLLGARQIEIVQTDLALPEDRDRLLGEVKKLLGGLDHLILNHAIVSIGWWLGSSQNMSRLEQLLKVNFVSYVDLSSGALEMLMASGGSIGVVSSIGGVFSIAAFSQYVATKFALHGFFGAFRQELDIRGAGISVTLCVIGFVDTDLGQMDEEQKRVMHYGKIFGLVETPEATALAILKGVTGRAPDIHHGAIASLSVQLYKVFPRTVEWLYSRPLITIHRLV